jgi:alpha-N-arabinofuranosidase
VKENTLCITLCNTHPEQPAELEVQVLGGLVSQAEAVFLTADDIHAHNTFEEPERVKPSEPHAVRIEGNSLRLTAPAASVIQIIGQL